MCERMWCGTGLWPDHVSLVSISKAFFIQEVTGGWAAPYAIADNQDCVELVQASCSEAVSFFGRGHACFLVLFIAVLVAWTVIPKAVAYD